jgi:hypothetical protein
MLEWLTGYGEAAIAVGSEAWMAHTRCHLSCGPEVVCSFSSALRTNVRCAHICAYYEHSGPCGQPVSRGSVRGTTEDRSGDFVQSLDRAVAVLAKR